MDQYFDSLSKCHFNFLVAEHFGDEPYPKLFVIDDVIYCEALADCVAS